MGALFALEEAVELGAFSGVVDARTPALLTLLATLVNVARCIFVAVLDNILLLRLLSLDFWPLLIILLLAFVSFLFTRP